MKRAYTDGISIAYDDLGRGEPALLFLTGWCADRSCFTPLMHWLENHRRVLSLDWRGHGDSGAPSGDFGMAQLVADALAVIRSSGAEQVIPVAQAHGGWVALELRRRLGARIPKMVLVEWLLLGATPPLEEALRGMQSREKWRGTVEAVFERWLQGVEHPELVRFVREGMGRHGYEMWARAAREISHAYAEQRSPLHALAHLDPPVETLHLYAQPDDVGFLREQENFAASHPWFNVRKLKARSHFPMLEVADEMGLAIQDFVETRVKALGVGAGR